MYHKKEALPGGSHVARLNFKTSCVHVYKCLSLIGGFAVNVAIWPREVVSCRDFLLHTVATLWAMSLVGIYPGRASKKGFSYCLFHNSHCNGYCNVLTAYCSSLSRDSVDLLSGTISTNMVVSDWCIRKNTRGLHF